MKTRMIGAGVHRRWSRACRVASITVIILFLLTLASHPGHPVQGASTKSDDVLRPLPVNPNQPSTDMTVTSASHIVQQSNTSGQNDTTNLDTTVSRGMEEQRLSPTNRIPNDTPASHCLPLPGSEDVLVVIKTGATEASRLIPTVLSTFAQCIPNLVIFSDLEQHIGGHMLHDALKSVSAHHKSTHPSFEFYRDLQTIYQEHGDVTAFGQRAENQEKAWALDKWKNIPMLHQAHQMHPNVRWHVYIDADTSLGFHNLVQVLQKFDHTLPLYIGNAHLYKENVRFAYGGAGYVISSAAVALFEKIYTKENVERWEAHTERICCGDLMLAIALQEARIRVRIGTPLMQVGTLRDVEWANHIWCQPSLTWHHVGQHEIEQLYEFERNWYTTWQTSYRFRDLFTTFVAPNLADTKDDWDNLSTNRTFREPDQTNQMEADEEDKMAGELSSDLQKEAVLSPSRCRVACAMDERCVQWLWKAQGSCSHNRFVKLGYQVRRTNRENDTAMEPQVISGWMMDRIENLEAEWGRKDCGGTWDV